MSYQAERCGDCVHFLEALDFTEGYCSNPKTEVDEIQKYNFPGEGSLCFQPSPLKQVEKFNFLLL